MTKPHSFIDIILIWAGVVTSFITPFMPLLQFIAVVLAIAVSLRALFTKRKNDRPHF